MRIRTKAWTWVCSAVLAAGLLGVHHSDASAATTQTCGASAYRLSLQSLTGPPRADLTIRITTAMPDCELPETLTAVQVALLPFKRSSAKKFNLDNVPSPGGTATVRIGRVPRHRVVHATVAFGPQIVLAGKARTLLKPDLVLMSVKTVKSILGGKPFYVVAQIRQRTRDVGATATVTVTSAGTALATDTVAVRARRSVVRQIAVTLPTTPGRDQLIVNISGTNPAETSLANNTRRATVEVVEFKVQGSATLVQNFAGYGGQFNHHVYAAISRSVGVTDANVGDMEAKMRALHPEFSRIFFTPVAFTDPDRMQSFIRTVLLAQSTGTTINITWQGGTLSVASGTVQKFADVLTDLVRNRGVTNLRWLTLQNEPNRTKITMEAYEAQYRALDPYISSIRGQVKYMGGDLVRGPDVGAPNQDVWFQYMATHMADILDAYSIHVFWDYWDTQKLVDRLTEVRAIVNALPESGRKPLYVAEYGVRGLRTFNGSPAGDPGVWEDGTPITRTNVSAFQHAWFDLLAARLGYMGTSKWDSYFGKYDNGTQAYYMIGSPQDGWPLYPLYNLVQLMTTTIKRDWRTVNVDSVPDTSRLLAAYVGERDQETVVGLDTAGAQLNTASGVPVGYTIGGLPVSQKVRLVIWNEAGDGARGATQTVTTDANGVVNITVPQQAVFVLTSLPLA
ncbi:MAG: hypothetical protein E6G33_12225 [Actinobacteria bacterium]|nr:MAG: hypothetical protein E6G33_12225 [Actinomycetota bacterium]